MLKLSAAEIFSVWAPAGSPWSQWVAPVIFTQVRTDGEYVHSALPDVDNIDLVSGSALILDLPNDNSVWLGLAFAKRGFRPVPLFNASPFPIDMREAAEPTASVPSFDGASFRAEDRVVLDMKALVEALGQGTGAVKALQLPPDSPPAFLLDSRRAAGTRTPLPRLFDNRWLVFPQDFPSARFLLQHGITRVDLVQADADRPQDDLAHVLLRWQEAGIQIYLRGAFGREEAKLLQVARPSRFRAAWYRMLTIMGLRRSSVGGFGSFIPDPTESGGGFG